MTFNAPDLAKYLLTEANLGCMVLLIDGLDEEVDRPAVRSWVVSATAYLGESS